MLHDEVVQGVETWCGSAKVGEPVIEWPEDDVLGALFEKKTSSAVVFPGGGGRGYAVAVGVLRGLREAKMLNQPRYFSGCETGAEAMFAFCVGKGNEDTLAGKYLVPEECSIEALDTAVGLGGGWQANCMRCLENCEAHGILALNEEAGDQIRKSQPSLMDAQFAVVRNDKLPFPMASASIRAPHGDNSLIPLVLTPLYFGSYASPRPIVYKSAESWFENNEDIVYHGGLISSFALGLEGIQGRNFDYRSTTGRGRCVCKKGDVSFPDLATTLSLSRLQPEFIQEDYDDSIECSCGGNLYLDFAQQASPLSPAGEEKRTVSTQDDESSPKRAATITLFTPPEGGSARLLANREYSVAYSDDPLGVVPVLQRRVHSIFLCLPARIPLQNALDPSLSHYFGTILGRIDPEHIRTVLIKKRGFAVFEIPVLPNDRLAIDGGYKLRLAILYLDFPIGDDYTSNAFSYGPPTPGRPPTTTAWYSRLPKQTREFIIAEGRDFPYYPPHRNLTTLQVNTLANLVAFRVMAHRNHISAILRTERDL